LHSLIFLQRVDLIKGHILEFLMDHLSRAARRGAADLSFLTDALPRGDRRITTSIVQAIRDAIAAGRLRPGDRLPSTRSLAGVLRVSRGVFTSAYEQLGAEGHVEARHGSGVYVTAVAVFPAPPMSTRPRPSILARLARFSPPLVDGPLPPSVIDLRPCRPAVDLIAAAPWRRTWAWAASRPASADYGPPAGEPAMREAIAGHLRRARGFAAGPEDLVITAGAAEAFHLIARLLVRPGDHVAVEDPGYPMARLAFEAAGATVVPVGVDESGLKVDALKRARLVYVTPSHQFPSGARMTLARRRQLLAWAEDHDVIVIEDDYDGEFRFDGPPLPPLASLAGAERVVYVGTFSKTLTPTVRLGFVAAPELAVALAQRKAELNYHVGRIPQLALSRFIEEGELDRHIARVRRAYALRRAALLEAIHALSLQAQGVDAGLHVVLPLVPCAVAQPIADACHDRGLAVAPLSRYALTKVPPALVLGFAAEPPERLRAGAKLLKDVLDQTLRGNYVSTGAAIDWFSSSGT
jgi:GntR family transcriptional regulator / MocR family aminotransferase